MSHRHQLEPRAGSRTSPWSRSRLTSVIAVALALSVFGPIGQALAAETTTVPLHAPHRGTVADCGAQGVLWHFVLNRLDAGTPSGTLTATFAPGGAFPDAGAPVGIGRMQHFHVATGSSTLLDASAMVEEQSGFPMLVLSDWQCQGAPPASNPPASNPPTPPTPPGPPNPPNPPNPPGDPESGIGVPAGGTLASSGGPTVVMLPDTATSTASASLALLAGMALLGGSTTLVVVTVRRNRSRRR